MNPNILLILVAGIVALFLWKKNSAATPGSPAATTPTTTVITDPWGIVNRTSQVGDILRGTGSLFGSLGGLFGNIKATPTAQTVTKTMDTNLASVSLPYSFDAGLGQFVDSPDTTYFYGSGENSSYWAAPVDYTRDFAVQS